jgi:hypothetical protein
MVYTWTLDMILSEYFIPCMTCEAKQATRSINAIVGVADGWTLHPDFNRTDADVTMMFFAPNAVS